MEKAQPYCADANCSSRRCIGYLILRNEGHSCPNADRGERESEGAVETAENILAKLKMVMDL